LEIRDLRKRSRAFNASLLILSDETMYIDGQIVLMEILYTIG